MNKKCLLGMRFGRLVVIDEPPGGKAVVKCDCGTTTKVLRSNLRVGHTTSCGCWRREMIATRNSRTVDEKLHDKIVTDPKTGCMEFTGHANRKGYGQVKYEGKQWSAHRLAYRLHHGGIPAGLSVLHKCDNPSCCNIEHLYAGTPSDNMKDKMRRGRHVAHSGESHWNAKLTAVQVEGIRKLRATGQTYQAIGDAYGVSLSTVRRVVLGISWAK